MKNLFTNSILNFLLILTLAFSPTITLAQEVIEAESEEPAQETVVEEQIPEVSIEVEEVVEVEEPIVHTNIINEVEETEPVVEVDIEVEETEITENTNLISDLVEQVVEDLVEPLVSTETAPATSEEIEVATITETATTTPEVIPTLSESIISVEKVELGVTYKFASNEEVQVTFTKLPENPGSLSIEEIKLTPDQVESLGLLSDVAYDITSNMENGSFEYDLKLPLQEGVEEISKVIYAESVEELSDILVSEVSSEQIEVVPGEDSVVVSDLNHFTIFVVVPTDIVNRTFIPFNPFIQGWSLEKTGAATIGLVTSATAGVANDFGPHIIKMTRIGGAQSFLGYFKNGLKLNNIEEVKWNTYSKTGTDTHLNIYLRKNILETAVVSFSPSETANVWQENVLSTATSITVRKQHLIFGASQVSFSSFANLISSQYGTWDLRVDADAKAGIAVVVGSASPTSPQEHYVDGVTLRISGIEEKFNFADVNTGPVVTIETPTPLENAYVKGIITSRALATDDRAMGSYYLRYWKGAFESGIENLVHGCQEAPGAELLGASLDRTCTYDTRTNSDGVYVFSAQFLDSDTTWGSALRTFKVDNTKPVVTLENEPSETVFRSDSIDFEIKATDNFALKNVVGHIYKNGLLFDNNSKNILGESTEDTFTVDISSLNDGEYALRYNASDKAGNIATTKIFNFVIDNTAPETPVHESPADESAQNINDFYFEWSDVSDAVEYEFQASQSPSTDEDGKLNSGVWNNKDNGSGDQLLLTDSRIHSTGANGTWYWQVRAIDEAGNESDWSTPWEMTIDMVAPTVPVILSPSSEQAFTSTPILNEWSVSTDDAAVSYQIAYSYDDNHTIGESTCSELTEIDGKFISGCRNTTNTTIDHNPSLDEQGGVVIWVRAIDALGNTSEWSTPVHYTYEIQTTTTSSSRSSNRRDDGEVLGAFTSRESDGEVLGASTGICEMLITDYMKMGQYNNPEQVLKLQKFLNSQGFSVPETGFYGPLTTAAVKKLQEAHADEILQPWIEAGIVTELSPTGNVYKLTRYFINNTNCAGSEVKPTL